LFGYKAAAGWRRRA